MSNIRVTYSGLISFVIGIISVFTGLIFTFIVTRTFTPIEYGTWNLINGLFGYVIIIEPIISYWTTREISRNLDSGKTAIFSSGLFSIIAIIGYIVVVFLVAPQTDVNQNVLFFAVMLIPVIFLNKTLTAINLGWKPHAISYGSLFYSIAQIPLALLFIYFLELGVYGIIITSLIAYIISIIILGIYGFEKIKTTFHKKFLKKYLSYFWISLYPGIGSMIYFLDVSIFSIITKSVEGLSLWAVSLVVPNIISQSALISRAVYPKLLGASNDQYLKGNLTQLFYFAMPLTALAITFSRPALFVLNPIYDEAATVIIFTSLFVFLNTISGVFQSLLTGTDKVDISESSTIQNYIRSKLFFMPTLSLIQYGSYAFFLTIFLLLFASHTSQLNLVIYWSIIALLTQLPITIYLYILVRQKFTSFLDYTSIFKYFFTSLIVFGLNFLLMENFLNYDVSFIEFIPNLLLLIGLTLGSYLTITYIVDSRTKVLFQSIFKEIKN